MKQNLLNSLRLGVILQWLSLFFSYRLLQTSGIDPSRPYATGGFPLKIFEYPGPALGNDWPPLKAWPMFFLNLAIWIILSYILITLLGPKAEGKKVSVALSISTLVFTALGAMYLALQFD